MPDWLKDFLQEPVAVPPAQKNRPGDFGKSPQNSSRFFSPHPPQKTDRRGVTYPDTSVFKRDNFEWPGKSEEIDQSGNRAENLVENRTDKTDETFDLPAWGELKKADKTDETPPIALDAVENELTKADETPPAPEGSVKNELTKPPLEGHFTVVESATRHRPPDVSDAQWKVAIWGLKAFLEAGHADVAEAAGWTKNELYRVPELWSRVDLCGCALLIGDRQVVDISSTEIRIKTSSGATLAFYRKPKIDYGVAYRARIKMVGEDASKEEFQLRALEAVVSLYLTHHPGADIDAAKAAVLAAINNGESR